MGGRAKKNKTASKLPPALEQDDAADNAGSPLGSAPHKSRWAHARPDGGALGCRSERSLGESWRSQLSKISLAGKYRMTHLKMIRRRDRKIQRGAKPPLDREFVFILQG